MYDVDWKHFCNAFEPEKENFKLSSIKKIIRLILILFMAAFLATLFFVQ